MKRKRGEAHIGDLMDSALRAMKVRNQVREAQIELIFAEVVGEALSPMCRAQKIERNTLVVAVSNGPLAHQLRLDSQQLLAELNRRLGTPTLERIRFVPLPPP